MGGSSADGSMMVASAHTQQALQDAPLSSSAVLPLLLDGVLQEGVLGALQKSLHRSSNRNVHQNAAQIMWILLSWPQGIKSLCVAPHAAAVCEILHTLLAGADAMKMDDESLVRTADSIMLVMKHEDGLLLPFDLERARKLLEYPSQHGKRNALVQHRLQSCWEQFQLSFFGG
jgi:hypothetical protein